MFSEKSILETAALLFLENGLDELDLLCIYDVLGRDDEVDFKNIATPSLPRI